MFEKDTILTALERALKGKGEPFEVVVVRVLLYEKDGVVHIQIT